VNGDRRHSNLSPLKNGAFHGNYKIDSIITTRKNSKKKKKILEAHLKFNYIITGFIRRTQQQKITNNDYSVLYSSFKDEGGGSLVFQDKYGSTL